MHWKIRPLHGPARVAAFVFLAALARPDDSPAQGLDGEQAEDRFGASAAAVGDVNGDGYADFVLGAPGHDAAGEDAGCAYVYFGRYGAWPAEPDLVLFGQTGGDGFGSAVAAAGDQNGDDYDDFLVGAPGRDTGGSESGRVYLFLGGGTPDATFDATWDGGWPGARFGSAVAGGFDFNGDELPDFAVGAPDHSQTALRSGEVSLFLGGFSIPEEATYVFRGDQANWALGASLDGAGDVNGDGLEDLLAGAPQPFDFNPGRAVIWFGQSFPLGSPDRLVLAGETGGDQFGWDVSGAGDVNGDSYDDVAVGAPRYALDNGAAYAFFGGASMNAGHDWRATGADGGDEMGFSVDGGFDLNGDSRPDILVGSPGSDVIATGAGRIAVYYGRPTLSTTPDRLESPDAPVAGFEAGDRFGAPARFVGSLNGDAFDEIAACAPDGNTASGSPAGYANLLSHGDTFVPVRLASFTALAAPGGVRLAWRLVETDALAGLRVERTGGGTSPRPIHEGWLPPDRREIVDPEGAAGLEYRLVALDRASGTIDLGTVIAGGGTPVGPVLSAHRNPFREGVELRLAVPPGGAATVVVRDVRGRTVRTLLDGPLPGGPLAWDGTDAIGRNVPPGVYVVTAFSGAAAASLKLVRLP